MRQILIIFLISLLASCQNDPGTAIDRSQLENDTGSSVYSRPSDTLAQKRVNTEDTTSAEAAVKVLHEYYTYINNGSYAKAYRLWGNQGQASGQSLQDFQDGFSETKNVQVVTGTPGRIEGAAGSRYIDIPVTITATKTNGQQQNFAGTYTIRRAVIEGADYDQRHWRIYKAEIKEK